MKKKKKPVFYVKKVSHRCAVTQSISKQSQQHNKQVLVTLNIMSVYLFNLLQLIHPSIP